MVCLLLCKEEGSSPVSLQLLNYVGVKSSLQHAREECESKRAYVF